VGCVAGVCGEGISLKLNSEGLISEVFCWFAVTIFCGNEWICMECGFMWYWFLGLNSGVLVCVGSCIWIVTLLNGAMCVMCVENL
jgi:hypothetical protein